MDHPKSREALRLHDQHAPAVDALLDVATTNEQVAFWQYVTLCVEDRVRQAFLCDTADRNLWSGVRCMPLSDIRRTVEGA